MHLHPWNANLKSGLESGNSFPFNCHSEPPEPLSAPIPPSIPIPPVHHHTPCGGGVSGAGGAGTVTCGMKLFHTTYYIHVHNIQYTTCIYTTYYNKNCSTLYAYYDIIFSLFEQTSVTDTPTKKTIVGGESDQLIGQSSSTEPLFSPKQRQNKSNALRTSLGSIPGWGKVEQKNARSIVDDEAGRCQHHSTASLEIKYTGYVRALVCPPSLKMFILWARSGGGKKVGECKIPAKKNVAVME